MTPQPEISYLVCATPRSGSTLLCEMLRATGLAGCPAEHFEALRRTGLPRQPREYFEGVADPAVLELLPAPETGSASTEPAPAWRERILRQGRTPNGAWGGKLMWGHVPELLGHARELDGLAGAELATVVRSLLGDVRLVFVTRRDKVAQAVSLWRAIQTGRWRADARADPAPPAEVYRFAAIDHLAGQLAAHDAAWRDWFANRAPSLPLVLDYDELVADPRATVGRVLRFAGLPAVDPGEPPLRAQRDARSDEWAQRYAREREERRRLPAALHG
jgi:trehalose 2-sulfotransferase